MKEWNEEMIGMFIFMLVLLVVVYYQVNRNEQEVNHNRYQHLTTLSTMR